MTSRAALRNAIWQACTAIRNEHRDVKKYVEYTAVLLFFKFYDDLYDTLPDDVGRIIPERYRWHILKGLDPRGFAGFNPEVLARFREFFQDQKWKGKAAFGAIFENFAFDIKHDEVLGQALLALDRIDFAGMDYDQKGDLYEFLIAKMADAGVKGEFFTPRPIVDAIITLLGPRAGMRVWDPACGTAGFLARAFEEMRNDLDTQVTPGTESHNIGLAQLRTRSMYGCETEAVSARLARMNMLLRGDGHSTILEFNSLDRQTYASRSLDLRGKRVSNPIPAVLQEGGFDRIMANPPYGGSQAVSDVGTLLRPWTRTKKPEANFLQLMMACLKPGGECAVVLPEGVLFRRDELAIRQRLLRDFDVKSVIGLFQGAFEFAEVKACILHFRRPLESERWKGTAGVWIADTTAMPDIVEAAMDAQRRGPAGRMVSIDELRERELNLRPRFYLAEGSTTQTSGATIGDLFERVNTTITVRDDETYRQITVRTHGRGAVLRQEVVGAKIGTKRQLVVAAGDVVFSKIDARHGAYAVVPPELDGAIVSSDFPAFRAKDSRLSSQLLQYYLRFGPLADQFQAVAQGTTNRQRVSANDILETVLPLPTEQEQTALLRRLEQQDEVNRKALALLDGVDRYQWLDEEFFDVADSDVIAETFGSLVMDAADYVDPSQEPDTAWQLFSLTNRQGVFPGEQKLGREFTPGRRYKRVVHKAVAYDTRRVNVGSVGIMPAADRYSIMSPYRVVFRCNEELDPRFVVYVMKAPFFLERIREAQVGAVRDELFFKLFCDIPVRVPTLVRQREIIGAIDDQLRAYGEVESIANRSEDAMRRIVEATFAQMRTAS